MHQISVEEMRELLTIGEAERLAAIERSRRLCAELVKEYGEYRGPLPQRRVAGLGALKGGRFVVEVDDQFFRLVWFGADGFSAMSRTVRQNLIDHIAVELSAVANLSNTDRDTLIRHNWIELNTRKVVTEMEIDRTSAIKSLGLESDFDIPVVVLPKTKRFDIEYHENFHFDCFTIVIFGSRLSNKRPKEMRSDFNDFFLAVLETIQNESNSPKAHMTYREIIAPNYATVIGLGYEEIFARTATAEKNGLHAVIEEDVRILTTNSILAPANYPDIVRFCLKEIHDHVVRVYGSHAGLIAAARKHLGLVGEIPSF